MYVERLLQINIATLAAMGTLMLGMGQRSTGLPMLMIVVASCSIWLTDLTGWVRLNRKLANVAALAAVAFSLGELSYYAGEVQVLGIAPMLVYLQIVLLFQQKDQRIYWQLMVLSLLQVVVAAAFSQGVWFGCVLVIYMLVGFSALALLLQYRQSSRYRPTGKVPGPSAGGGRWPLSCEQSHFGSTPGGRPRAAICGELFARLAVMGLGTLALTLLLFFTVPRLGHSAWRGAGMAPRHVVGFSDEVTLGELGLIFESRQEVMRLALIDSRTGRHSPKPPELYLRGAVLIHYVSNDLQRGLWKPRMGGARRRRPIPEADAGASQQVVLQRITAEPYWDELFCVWPFVRTENTPRLVFDGDRLLRPRDSRGTRSDFELGTTAFVDGLQAPIVPLAPLENLDDVRPLLQLPSLPRLTALARQWMAESGLPAEDRIARARMLTRKFHDAGRFQYSLEGRQRDESIDPIEDFVANNPQGHCEYFATALALMLRSQGIPARVIVGYKCDEFDDLGNFYQVRQSHAHTWVEAYLEPEQIPKRLLGAPPQQWRPQQWAAGGWLRLEPTPGAAAESGWAATGDAALGKIEQAFHWLESLWSDYVMEMDRPRQQKAIYEPLVELAKGLFRRLGDPQWWRGVMESIAAAADVTRWSGLYWLWFALSLLVGVPLMYFGGRWARRGGRQVWSRLTGRAGPATGSDPPDVQFYRRLEVLLARRGLVRPTGQTQRQFATAAGAQIAQTTHEHRLASLPVTVAEAFYQVRFGRRPLDTHQTETVERALKQLAACD